MNVQVSLAAAMLLVAALVGLGWLARKVTEPPCRQCPVPLLPPRATMSGDPLNCIRVTADALALRRKGAQIPELAVLDGFTDEQLVKFLILDAARLLDQMTSDGGADDG